MESRGERIEKTRRETGEEVRRVMESSATLIPEVNPETLEEEEERNELAELYEAVADEYGEMYRLFNVPRFFETRDGREVLGKAREYVNYHLAKGKTDSLNISWAIRSLSAIISTPELKKLFTEEEINGWLIQAGDDGFKQMVKRDVDFDLTEGKTNSINASWAIRSLSAIHRLSESLFSEANAMKAKKYDEGKGQKPKPSSPRLPVKAF